MKLYSYNFFQNSDFFEPKRLISSYQSHSQSHSLRQTSRLSHPPQTKYDRSIYTQNPHLLSHCRIWTYKQNLRIPLIYMTWVYYLLNRLIISKIFLIRFFTMSLQFSYILIYKITFKETGDSIIWFYKVE